MEWVFVASSGAQGMGTWFSQTLGNDAPNRPSSLEAHSVCSDASYLGSPCMHATFHLSHGLLLGILLVVSLSYLPSLLLWKQF